jgi:hypothetical protein
LKRPGEADKDILLAIQCKYSADEKTDGFKEFFSGLKNYPGIHTIDAKKYEVVHLIVTNRIFVPDETLKVTNLLVVDRSLMPYFAPNLEHLLLSPQELIKMQIATDE